MSVHITTAAVGVIRRSLELAKLDPGESGVRLRIAGGEVRPRFARAPGADDEVVEVEGIRVFIAPEIVARHPDVEIGVSEEHETLLVRPASE